MGRQISIELINGVTVVTYVKDGKTSVQSTAKSRDIIAINGGIQIMPDKDETSFNNEKILISELTDNFGTSNGAELVKKFAELGFFKQGGGGVSEIDEGCFHLKDNTLKMCNLSTSFNNTPLGMPNGFLPNRVIAFVELPEYPICNIRCVVHVGFTKLFQNNTSTIVSPFKAIINSTIINKDEWLALTHKTDTYNFETVSYSDVSSDLENSPLNFLEKLKNNDLLDTPETLVTDIGVVYPNSEPLEVKTGFLPDGRKGIFLYLPKTVFVGISNSMFVNLSELEITFDNMEGFDKKLYKNFPQIILSDEVSLGQFENREITHFSTVVVGPPIGF
ncbi:hypothetical protein BTO06_04075 [Tenacibaculum sp. SZ-18]|uniref:hypothetical protein n=1 Tax=Tenacibaculum sp. SZ-18 TaxID=754423 RepID=UPI000C2D11F0|nr:hypothetical protein [Tenacibaculum sp. SZ-18]AUC13691.1 hypothetical protein BTO06_00370 [Tenacibaculum sp. SZ-18]AUC14370.1 hypothetical protein BTO06_04075 [Tenacibaculum sp. SZ-18]